LRFLARRIGFYLVTAWAAVTINFFIPRLMPGNPLDILVARMSSQGMLTPRAVHDLAVAFGFNTKASLLDLYFRYWGQLFRGDLGISVTYFPSSVASVIGTALPWTLALVGTATLISIVLGTFIGLLAAWRRSPGLDALLPSATFMQAAPYFFIGLLSIEVFSSLLKWFPVGGGFAQGMAISFTWSFISSALYHSLLPAITIIVTSMAGWMIGMRNVTVTVLDEDYILAAHAKGLKPRRVMITYAARNAILPQVASFALAMSLLVSGAILVEIVFSYPGIGYVLFQAVDNEDFPLMQAIFLIIVVTVLVANLLADLAYVLLDPRARQEAS